MSEFKGTKGKWKVVHSKSKDAFNVIGTVLGGNYKIARCPYLVIEDMPKHSESEKIECEANAKLIALAPEMLKAIEGSIPEIKEIGLIEMADYFERLIKKATQ